jgi:hypothetical protein
VVALWPDEKHLLEADESSGGLPHWWPSPGTLGKRWDGHRRSTQNRSAGPKPDLTPLRPLDPVVAEAVDGLGILVGQHKMADQRYRAAVAKGLTTLRRAGYALDPDALHTHAMGNGWRASNAEILRDVAHRALAGRVTAPWVRCRDAGKIDDAPAGQFGEIGRSVARRQGRRWAPPRGHGGPSE